jgi:3-deoxy-D-manno-octulosonic-acid transferase
LIILYNILIAIALLGGMPLVAMAILLSEKRRKTVLQRLGIVTVPKGIHKKNEAGERVKPIWVHALSVGEVLSAQPLIHGIRSRFEDRPIFFSASTRTGFTMAENKYRKDVDALFFFPYDLPFSVAHVCRRVDPVLVVLVESDLWPNFLFYLARKKIPVVLANARLSRRSFEGYRRVSFFIARVFKTFFRICAQSPEDAKRFSLLGIPGKRVSVVGNIKFDQTFEPLQPMELKRWRTSLGLVSGEKILVAGSTHTGEEPIVQEVFSRLKRDFPGLLLIIAPRDPLRSHDVCCHYKASGFSVVPYSDFIKKIHDRRWDVVVVDGLGVLRKLYAIADIAFVGGSLVDRGGHNPLEPAAHSIPILFGSHMGDFREIAALLLQEGGAIRVEDAEHFYRESHLLFKVTGMARKIGKNAFRVFSNNRGAVAKTLDVIEESFSEP